MKKHVLNITVLLTASLLIFSSCAKKIEEYAGFPVEEDIVTVTPETGDSLSLPWPLYKGIESGFVDFSKMFNRFSNITKSEIDSMLTFGTELIDFNLTGTINDEEAMTKQLGVFVTDEDEMKITLKSMENLTGEDLKKIDAFVNGIADYLDPLLFSVEQVCEYDNGDHWFNTYEDIFNAFVIDQDQQDAISFINKYFPAARLISKYSEVVTTVPMVESLDITEPEGETETDITSDVDYKI